MIPASLLLLLLLWGGTALAAPPFLSPPDGFRVLDTPNDAGKSLSLVWNAAPTDGKNRTIQVWVAEAPAGAFKKVAEFPSNTRYVKPGDFPWWAQDRKSVV